MRVVLKSVYHTEDLTVPEKPLRPLCFISHFLVDYDQSFNHSASHQFELKTLYLLYLNSEMLRQDSFLSQNR